MKQEKKIVRGDEWKKMKTTQRLFSNHDLDFGSYVKRTLIWALNTKKCPRHKNAYFFPFFFKYNMCIFDTEARVRKSETDQMSVSPSASLQCMTNAAPCNEFQFQYMM